MSPVTKAPQPKRVCMFTGCSKKLGALGGIECRCGRRFCSVHTIDHDCTFDYKGLSREHLTKTMIKPDDTRWRGAPPP